MLCDKNDSEEHILWLLVWTSFLILWVIPGPTFYNKDTIVSIWSWVWVRLCSVHLPHYSFLQIDDLTAELETASSKCLHLDAKNQVFQQELLSMKLMQKKCKKLGKKKKKLEQEVVNLRSHIEMKMIKHSQVAE